MSFLVFAPPPSVCFQFLTLIDSVDTSCISDHIMGPDRAKICELCDQNIKPRRWATHRKACERNAQKRAQDQRVAESIRQRKGVCWFTLNNLISIDIWTKLQLQIQTLCAAHIVSLAFDITTLLCPFYLIAYLFSRNRTARPFFTGTKFFESKLYFRWVQWFQWLVHCIFLIRMT